MRPRSQLTDGIGWRQHPQRNQEGQTQSFHFDLPEEERGPWYLSDEEREAQRHDRPTGEKKTKPKTPLVMLRLELKITAMLDRNKYRKADLQKMAEDHGIETVHVHGRTG
jgi:hypothetical protein